MLLSGLKTIVAQPPVAVVECSAETILTMQLEMAAIEQDLDAVTQVADLVSFVRDNITNTKTLSLRAFLSEADERLLFGGLLAELPVESAQESITERAVEMAKKAWEMIRDLVIKVFAFIKKVFSALTSRVNSLITKTKQLGEKVKGKVFDKKYLIVTLADMLYIKDVIRFGSSIYDWMGDAFASICSATSIADLTSKAPGLIAKFPVAPARKDGVVVVTGYDIDDKFLAAKKEMTLKEGGFVSAADYVERVHNVAVALARNASDMDATASQDKYSKAAALLDKLWDKAKASELTPDVQGVFQELNRKFRIGADMATKAGIFATKSAAALEMGLDDIAKDAK